MAAGRRAFPIGPLVAIAGSVLLLVSLFLDWYDDLSAWTAFELIDLVLAALAIATALSLLEQLGAGRARVRFIRSGAAIPLAVAALVIVVSQILNHPPAAVDMDPKVGLWLALAATALMALGAILATARISVALDVQRRDAAEAPTVSQPGPPGVERRPEP
jgi:hypothetical protein